MTRNDGSYWVYEYDTLGQVKSGKRYWREGTPVAGQQFEYAHDDIGNRTGTALGGNDSGTGLRPVSYTVNSLNQYESRTTPDQVDILGIAHVDHSVTVSVNSSAQSVTRRGEYFHSAATVTRGDLNAVDVSISGSSEDGDVYAPTNPETFDHDDDGNLVYDGRWDYTWDGENRLIEMEKRDADDDGVVQKITFEYDWEGRRIAKRTYNASAVLQDTRIYLYDGWNLIAELDGSKEEQRTYLWGFAAQLN